MPEALNPVKYDFTDDDRDTVFEHPDSKKRMDIFEAKIFGPKKKHARAPNKFDRDDYIVFIQSDIYKKLNDEILAIRKRKEEIKAMLFRALPTGEQYGWVEEACGMVVRIRPEWIDEVEGTRFDPPKHWLDNL